MKSLKAFLLAVLFSFFSTLSYAYSIDSLKQKLSPVEDTVQLWILNKLAVSYQAEQVYDTSDVYANMALNLAQKLHNKKEESEALYILAINRYRLDDFKVSKQLFIRSARILFTLKNMSRLNSIASFMGLCDDSNGDYINALKLYQIHYKMSEFLKEEKKQANALNNIGNIYETLGDYSKSLEYHYKSLAIATKLKFNLGAARSYNNIANLYADQKNHTKAIEFYLKSIELKDPQEQVESIIESLCNLGTAYAEVKEYQKSLEYYNQALKKAEGGSFIVELANVYLNKGLLHTLMQDEASAVKCFDESIRLAKLTGDDVEVAYVEFAYAKLKVDKKKYSEAETMYLRALEIAKASAVSELMIQIHQSLSDLYLTLKQPDKSLTHYKSYIEERDRQNIDDAKRTADKQELKFEFDKEKIGYEKEQEKKNLIMEDEKKMQKIFSYSIVTILILTLIFFTFLYNRYKLTQRQKVLISEQKQEVEHQKHIVEEKQKEIVDSINYAQRIQYALLANKKLLDKNLPDYFLLFKPKDVVSGDFYWAQNLSNGTFAVVTADSTGHGVPGAIMSILNIACLNESIKADKLTGPADILNATRAKVIDHLMHDGSTEGGKDGMDCSLISFDLKQFKLVYAAANNPVWIVRENKLISLPADKMPIGKHDKDAVPFKQTQVELQKGDVVYAFTDGYADQFGGAKGKKFKYKQLEELLLSIQDKPMIQQHDALDEAFEKWKGNLEQVDDVCVIGVRI
ncbi:MAG: tetratricopeptide repeat protein [Bacteroidota bacterium]